MITDSALSKRRFICRCPDQPVDHQHRWVRRHREQSENDEGGICGQTRGLPAIDLPTHPRSFGFGMGVMHRVFRKSVL